MRAGDGFSATNTPGIGAKLACVKLNTQTPSPPRGAVPVNLGRTWEALSFCSFRIEFGHGCDRPAMLAVFMPKRGLVVHLHSERLQPSAAYEFGHSPKKRQLNRK